MSKVVVYHGEYGCETGCCGHAVSIVDDDFFHNSSHNIFCWNRKGFQFEHCHSNDDAAKIEFAKDLVTKELGEDHVADLDWENCFIVSWDEC